MPINTGTAVRELEIGPFSGGINTYSDPAMIADDEMVDCVNFDIALDGSLKSRPPWVKMPAGSATLSGNQYVMGTGTYEGFRFIVYTSNHEVSTYRTYIYYVDGPNAGISAKIADGKHSKSHRYADDIYLVPDLNNYGKGASWDLSGGAVTVHPTMPDGYASVVYKDRLWISGRRGASGTPTVSKSSQNSRLFFSDLAKFNTWPATNFFDINPGDGDAVNQLSIYQDNILIFKDNVTYVLAYDTGPAQAVLQVINSAVGAMGRDCVAPYENSIFVLKYNQVYEMSNYDFTRISVKLPFEFNNDLPVAPYAVAGQSWQHPMWLKVVGDRLYVRFWNRLYVYHLRLRAWTRFTSVDPNIQYIGPPIELDNTNTGIKRGFETYVAGSSLSKSIDKVAGEYIKLFDMQDQYENVRTENGDVTPPATPKDIKLVFLSKQYDIGVSHRFKRLMHWGLDCYTKRPVTGTLLPFSLAYKVTWAQLHNNRWHDLSTWGYPLSFIPGVAQSVPVGAGDQTKFIRFPKSLRFRLLQFRIDMVTVGNLDDGPVFIYSVTAFVAGKQLVPKAVN